MDHSVGNKTAKLCAGWILSGGSCANWASIIYRNGNANSQHYSSIINFRNLSKMMSYSLSCSGRKRSIYWHKMSACPHIWSEERGSKKASRTAQSLNTHTHARIQTQAEKRNSWGWGRKDEADDGKEEAMHNNEGSGQKAQLGCRELKGCDMKSQQLGCEISLLSVTSH